MFSHPSSFAIVHVSRRCPACWLQLGYSNCVRVVASLVTTTTTTSTVPNTQKKIGHASLRVARTKAKRLRYNANAVAGRDPKETVFHWCQPRVAVANSFLKSKSVSQYGTMICSASSHARLPRTAKYQGVYSDQGKISLSNHLVRNVREMNCLRRSSARH